MAFVLNARLIQRDLTRAQQPIYRVCVYGCVCARFFHSFQLFFSLSDNKNLKNCHCMYFFLHIVSSLIIVHYAILIYLKYVYRLALEYCLVSSSSSSHFFCFLNLIFTVQQPLKGLSLQSFVLWRQPFIDDEMPQTPKGDQNSSPE